MSDLYAWPAQSQPEPASSGSPMAGEFEAIRDRMRTLIAMVDRDDPVRPRLVADLLRFDDLAARVQPQQREPVVGHPVRRDVGVDTRAWIAGQTPLMRRNRGHQ